MQRGRKKKKQITKNKDIQVVILIILSILLAVLIYKKSGYIGETLSPMLGGIIGWIKYILPFGTLAIGLYIACEEEKEYILHKLIQYGILIICISTIVTSFQIDNGIIDSSKGIKSAVIEAYDKGTENIGGGAVGALVAVLLIDLVDVAGTIIISIGAGVISLIFLFGVRPTEILKNYVNKRKEKKEDKDEKKKKNIEQRKLINNNKILDKKADEILENQIKIKMTGEEVIKNGIAGEPFFKKEEKEEVDKSKQVLVLEHTLTVEDEKYEFPPIELLKAGKLSNRSSKKAITDIANKLQKTLYSFGVSAKVENVSVGPTITRYELKPAEGVRVSKIANLADDIALNLAAETIRIEAPIPGKQAVGIEVPNKDKDIVALRDIVDCEKFKEAKSKLTIALGKDAAGEEVITDIAKMPHVLIAGSTGSGKSVCINSLITSIIYKSKPSEVKLVMVDPKVVELSIYNGIPHLLIPVVTDPKKAAGALAWAVQEMENRYHLFADKNVRDIEGYNDVLLKEGNEEKLPQILIIIDELADLMMVASKDVEDAICRLAQKARAAGMHLVVATQRPSVDVITGLIKANVATRIAFAVASQIDSRTILDSAGAEKLLGKGDMLFSQSGGQKPLRIQCAYISDGEVESIVEFLKKNGGPTYSQDVLEKIERANSTDQELDENDEDDTDPFLADAIETVIEMGQASASFIQRRFKVGYARAGRIIDQMEARGIISGYEGSKPRQVLMDKERWQELNMSKTSENNEN